MPAASWATAVARGFAWWTALAAIVVLLRTPWLAWRAWKGRAVATLDKLLALGACFELALLVLFTLARVPVVPHYYAVLIPFPTLAALWLGWRIGQGLGDWPLVAASALVVGAHTQLSMAFLDELALHGPPPEMHYAQPFHPHAAQWRVEIARLFDEVDSGRASERAEQERLRRKFEASSEVLMRCDPRAGAPDVAAQGRLELHAGPQGLEVLGSSALDMLRLPPFELGGRGRALLRLEFWAPKEIAGCVFYATATHPDYSGKQALALDTHPGENLVYFEIPDPAATGRLMVRHGAQRWVLRAAEVRRVED
jgi:hypothetical protein